MNYFEIGQKQMVWRQRSSKEGEVVGKQGGAQSTGETH